MAEDFNLAHSYSGEGGVIVELQVSPQAHLSGGDGVWYTDLPNLFGKYVRLSGIIPKRLFDNNKNRIY